MGEDFLYWGVVYFKVAIFATIISCIFQTVIAIATAANR